MPIYSWDTAQYVEFTGTLGTNDNDIVYQSDDVHPWHYHGFECTAGTIDVDVSLDGENYIQGVAMEDVTSASKHTTLVVEAAAGKMVQLAGVFKKIRVRQKGATASNVRGAHGMSPLS